MHVTLKLLTKRAEHAAQAARDAEANLIDNLQDDASIAEAVTTLALARQVKELWVEVTVAAASPDAVAHRALIDCRRRAFEAIHSHDPAHEPDTSTGAGAFARAFTTARYEAALTFCKEVGDTLREARTDAERHAVPANAPVETVNER